MIESRIEDSSTALRILAALVIFLGLVEFFTVFFNLAGVMISWVSALSILILSAGPAGIYFHLFPRRPGPSATADPGSFWLSASVKALVCLAALIYGSLWLLAYALPDFSYDGLWYHIPAMHFWGLAGRIHWIGADLPSSYTPLIDNCLNGFPKAVELFTFVLVRVTGLPRLVNSVNLPFLPLGALSIVVLARTLGANRVFSALAGVLFILVPVNLAQSPTSYVDTATASIYLSSFALLAATLVRLQRGVIFWRGLIALGAAGGLAMGAKTPGIIFPPVIALVLAGSFLTAGSRHHFSQGKTVFRAAVFISLFFLVAILVGGYWPIRNFVHTGNPINPVGVKVAGWTIFPDYSWPGQFHSPYPEGTEEWSQARRIVS
ncbi:MAG: hypothetical protein P9M08_05370, partial [Candidatus Erginobacter occultus]|nr:hypothetical protein [Candidatus Erginobacter occultus]